MRRLLILLVLTLSTITALAESVVVNCDAGRSLNNAISKLNKQEPNTVLVEGTCTEYVTIAGFENLTVKSTTGATLVQPSVIPTKLLITTMGIHASRSVLIEGLTFQSTSSSPSPIGIGEGSTDVRLRNLDITGGVSGIISYEKSQVSMAGVKIRNSGYASVGLFDGSDLHVESCLFEDTTGTSWHQGIVADGNSHVTIRRTTIRDMQVGIRVGGGSEVDVNDFNTYYPAGGVSDVVIENPKGLNSNGVVVERGSVLAVNDAKLRILNAGQTYGGSSGGILVAGRSTMNASADLIISGSQGQGIYVTGDSQATLDGSSITGNHHGGLVAVNLSSISTVTWDLPVTVSGNATDVFCDSQSVITGGSKIINASSVQCSNLLPGDSVAIP